jgi:hypothetical protein
MPGRRPRIGGGSVCAVQAYPGLVWEARQGVIFRGCCGLCWRCMVGGGACLVHLSVLMWSEPPRGSARRRCSEWKPHMSFEIVPGMVAHSCIIITSWGHRRGTPFLTLRECHGICGWKPIVRLGVVRGGAYIVMFLKTPPYSRWLSTRVLEVVQFSFIGEGRGSPGNGPDSGGSRGGNLGRVVEAAPWGLLVSVHGNFSFLYVFYSFSDVISSMRHITCTSCCTSFPLLSKK